MKEPNYTDDVNSPDRNEDTQYKAVKDISNVYRLCPCPSYDVEGMESWLEDMARQGLQLSQGGFFMGGAFFEKEKPSRIKYRLVTSSKRKRWFDDEENGELLTDDSRGYRLIARRGNFNIYGNESDQLIEYYQDTSSHVKDLKQAMKYQLDALWTWIIALLIPLLFKLRGQYIIRTLSIGLPVLSFGLMIVIWYVIKKMKAFAYLRKIKNKVLQGEMSGHRKPWEATGKLYWILHISFILSICLFLGLFVYHGFIYDLEDRTIEIEAYDKQPPFATFVDIVPSGEYQSKYLLTKSGVQETSDILAPVMIRWKEHATVKSDDSIAEGYINVDYYETISSLLAKRLKTEYLEIDKNLWEIEKIDISIPEINDLMVYRVGSFYYGLIIVENNKMIHAIWDIKVNDKPLAVEEVVEDICNHFQ